MRYSTEKDIRLREALQKAVGDFLQGLMRVRTPEEAEELLSKYPMMRNNEIAMRCYDTTVEGMMRTSQSNTDSVVPKMDGTAMPTRDSDSDDESSSSERSFDDEDSALDEETEEEEQKVPSRAMRSMRRRR